MNSLWLTKDNIVDLAAMFENGCDEISFGRAVMAAVQEQNLILLTDKELSDIANEYEDGLDEVDFAFVVLAKLKEKN